jgi:hypothetical protein
MGRLAAAVDENGLPILFAINKYNNGITVYRRDKTGIQSGALDLEIGNTQGKIMQAIGLAQASDLTIQIQYGYPTLQDAGKTAVDTLAALNPQAISTVPSQVLSVPVVLSQAFTFVLPGLPFNDLLVASTSWLLHFLTGH